MTHLQFAVFCSLFIAPVAHAHHEALFGPHSSLMLSSPTFVSVQTFTRQTGYPTHLEQETNPLLAAGVTPSKKLPISITAVLPFTIVTPVGVNTPHSHGGGHSHGTGIEDLILGARLKLDISPLQEKFERDGNYVLFMLSPELPTGNVEHPAFQGPFDWMYAGLYSIEVGPVSAIAYGMYRRNGWYQSVRDEDKLFLGTGVAYTREDSTGHLLSFQLGFTHETYFEEQTPIGGITGTGGAEVLVHPTFVVAPTHGVLTFASVSVPLWQRFDDRERLERFRAGLGVVFAFGH
jgi:hypothetical protein